MTQTDEDMKAQMVKGWGKGLPETPCGGGATIKSTERIRKWLPKVASEYQIRSINDAGAGLIHWIGHVIWDRPITYKAYDLVPRQSEVTAFDITQEVLPRADAILCRMVLNHLDAIRVVRAINRFRSSGAKYLIATQFDGNNLKVQRGFTRWDFSRQLGEPLGRSPDGTEDECCLALWRL